MSRKRRPRPAGAPNPLWGSVYPTLDLHGDTAEEASRRTSRWLDEQRRAGAGTVRVVTGKGLHSIGPPVLRGEIEALLQALRGSLVRRFTAEPGGGVFRIELRPPPAPSLPAAASRPPYPAPTAPPRPATHRNAELRRRAEEALWELGVEPTPALIEIEMRRLRRQGLGGGA